ncbi:collagen alpha-1(I) chain-like [Hippopotamus amphibius kiboko]|uniref:collagen alpha-1(I) chain-like n=1 Tax=Hippopotamus amphibius kiboko TaxID=575201 RepID=UPI0025976342|nr:collagen alpha-1(I) chain-like [Hippopotamus amphibius kiboko]
MAETEAPAGRTGGRPREMPRGGRPGVGPTPGPRRRRWWWPRPGPGPGSTRYGRGGRGGAGSGQSGASGPPRTPRTAGSCGHLRAPAGSAPTALASARQCHPRAPSCRHPHLGQGHPLGLAPSGCQCGLPSSDSYAGRPSSCCDPGTEKPCGGCPAPAPLLGPLCFPGEAPRVGGKATSAGPSSRGPVRPTSIPQGWANTPRVPARGAGVQWEPQIQTYGGRRFGAAPGTRRSPRLLLGWLGVGQTDRLVGHGVGILLVPLAPSGSSPGPPAGAAALPAPASPVVTSTPAVCVVNTHFR